MIKHFLAGTPVILLIVFGYILRQFKFLKLSTVDDIKKLVLNITLPALLFTSFLGMKIDISHLAVPVIVVIFCIITLFAGKFLGPLVKMRNPYFPFLISSYGIGVFSYAIFMALYGEHNLHLIAFLDIGMTTFVFTIYIAMLEVVVYGKSTGKNRFVSVITSPMILAVILGGLLGSFNIIPTDNSLFVIVKKVISMLGSTTVPIISLSIGYSISIDKKSLALSSATVFWRKLLAVALMLIVNELIIPTFLPFAMAYRHALMILALTPPSILVSIMVPIEDVENSNYVNTTISIDSIVSLFLMILTAAVYW
ncbi:MAG: AEC family transporter [Sphaerochaetaceae bacterium]|jgi:predicted permease